MHACLFRRSSRCLLGLLIAWLALPCLAAAEHHGSVTFNGLPVPGVTIMLTQGDKTMTTVSDIQGLYSFADVREGIWRIRLERLCFCSITREVAISSGAPGPEWELKLFCGLGCFPSVLHGHESLLQVRFGDGVFCLLDLRPEVTHFSILVGEIGKRSSSRGLPCWLRAFGDLRSWLSKRGSRGLSVVVGSMTMRFLETACLLDCAVGA